MDIYRRLDGHFGDLGWWPADSPFEMMVGAVLTQNTAWRNVEKSIGRLKEERLLQAEAIRKVPEERLAACVRSSGYFRVKARRLKALADFLCERYGGSADRLSREDAQDIRCALLSVPGIGEETADSILLYACGKPVFVVDAYTRRILSRHRLATERASYGELQQLFHRHLPPDAPLFNQYHALLVYAGKTFCRKQPRCAACPLREVRPGSGDGGRAEGAATP